ncbi:IclR family transcriptional regulator [Microvirga sp. VF16]|uniref:IclR family transcriptional regulator n=1 Tax=Microvirga sp. VF16 TaxID=2807101 RepID=UPI001FEE5F23|nr:IclR family transcriptional regulator C-terminal domain-containing protein [Microvirga sp. VF16]
MVQSVEKAFRVLRVFDGTRPNLSLSQIVDETGLDMSAAQRFTHTLTKLGYLAKDADTKRFELTVKALDFGYHYARASTLVERGMPYLMHLSKTTEETVNLTVLDDTEIVFVSRFMSRHVLNNDVIIGTRLPAYCTAPGIAILARLPKADAQSILDRSDLRPFTPHTTWSRDAIAAKLQLTATRGYATAFEEYFYGDLSLAAAILDSKGIPYGAINIAVSRSRYTPEEAEERFASLVVAAAHSISQSSHSRR